MGAAFFTARWTAADAEVRGSRSVFRSDLRSRIASSPPEGGHYDEVRLKSDTTYTRVETFWRRQDSDRLSRCRREA